MSACLVVGGSGFIGSRLVNRQLVENQQVIVVDPRALNSRAQSNPRLFYTQSDCMALDDTTLKSASTVIYLAYPQLSGEYSALSNSVNSVCEFAKRCRAVGVRRFIFASSCSVYGNVLSLDIVGEETEKRPLGAYAVHKALCEDQLEKIAENDFCIIILRAATAYGLSERQRFDLLINRMILSAILKNEIVVSNGNSLRPVAHVDDIAEVYSILISAHCDHNFAVYNAAFDVRTATEHATDIATITGASVHQAGQDSGDRRSYQVSSKKLMQHFGFTRKHTVDEVVHSLGYKLKLGEYADAFTSGKYSNERTGYEPLV